MKPKRRPFTNMRGSCHVQGAQSGGKYLSKLERFDIVHWLLNPLVEEVKFAAPRISYLDEQGEKPSYLSDLAVRFKPGVKRRPLAIQCKYQSEIDAHPELKKKFELVERALAELGWEFLLRTDDDIFTPEYPNKWFILGYHNDSPSDFEDEILAHVLRQNQVPLGELLTELRSDEQAQLFLIPVVWRLVARKRLFIDFGRTASLSTVLHATPLPADEMEEKL